MPSMTVIRTWPKLRFTLILVACISAFSALFLLLRPTPGTPALALARDIARGEALTSAHIRQVYLPEDAVPRDLIPIDSALPERWAGEHTLEGTVLSESVLAGSALGRSLRKDESLISITLDAAHIPPLEAGDHVDLWGFPESCEATTCKAQRLTRSGRISSITVDDTSAWGAAPLARIDLIVDAAHTESVLGHAGTGTLNLTLTPFPTQTPTEQTSSTGEKQDERLQRVHQ